jgi:zinc transport system permease protein
MADDFFLWRPLLAAVGIALAAAPFGCFLVWRGMAFAGDAITHSALLGVALALVFAAPAAAGIIIVACAFAVFLFAMRRRLPDDTPLAIGAHAALAAGVVILVAKNYPVDWEGYFFGDILSAGTSEAAASALVCAGLALAVLWMRDALLLATISADTARIEIRRLARAEFLFYLLLAVFIALAVRLAGLLLVNALMIVPAAAARPLAKSPMQMAAFAAIIGALAAVVGVFASARWDWPAGPAIVLVAAVFFAVIWIIKRGRVS